MVIRQMSVIHTDPEILSGEPVFRGTRVPLQNLFDYLKEGPSMDDFLEGFPGVSRESAVTALEEAQAALVAKLMAGKK